MASIRWLVRGIIMLLKTSTWDTLCNNFKMFFLVSLRLAYILMADAFPDTSSEAFWKENWHYKKHWFTQLLLLNFSVVFYKMFVSLKYDVFEFSAEIASFIFKRSWFNFLISSNSSPCKIKHWTFKRVFQGLLWIKLSSVGSCYVLFCPLADKARRSQLIL